MTDAVVAAAAEAARVAEARARHYVRTGEWIGKAAARGSRSPER